MWARFSNVAKFEKLGQVFRNLKVRSSATGTGVGSRTRSKVEGDRSERISATLADARVQSGSV
jgi:hypothetical protein